MGFGLTGIGSPGDLFNTGQKLGVDAVKSAFDKVSNPALILGTSAAEQVKAALPQWNFSDTYNEVDLSNKDYYGVPNPHIGYAWIKIPEGDLFAGKQNTGQTYSDTIKEFLSSATGFVETRPNNFKRLKFQRFTQGIGNFEMTLFDHNFQELETKLRKSRGSIVFKYGYTTNEQKASPWILGRVFSYNIQLGLEGVTLNLTGMAVGHELATRITWEEKNTKHKLISELVEDLASSAGFDPVVEPTVAIPSRDGMESLEIKSLSLPNVGGETTLEYVVRQLIPYAQNSKGDSRYVFYIETKEGKTELHFHTLSYLDPKTGGSFRIPTFTWFKNSLSPILDYQPNWNRSLIDLSGAAGTFSPIYNLKEQTVQQIFSQSDTDPEEPMKEKVVDTDTGCYIVTQSNLYGNTAATQLRAQAESQKKRSITISATLKVVGSPKFQICDSLAVIVYLPRQLAIGNISSASKIYETASGLFRIIGITDILENGQYVTELSLATEGKQLVEETNKKLPSISALPTSNLTLGS